MNTHTDASPIESAQPTSLVGGAADFALSLLKCVLPTPWYWRCLAWRVGYFDAEIALLRHICDRNKVSVDVGASPGNYTVHLLNHSAKCYAFESEPRLAAYLRRRLMVRPHARLQVEAVSLCDRSGIARLTLSTNDGGPDRECSAARRPPAKRRLFPRDAWMTTWKR